MNETLIVFITRRNHFGGASSDRCCMEEEKGGGGVNATRKEHNFFALRTSKECCEGLRNFKLGKNVCFVEVVVVVV